MATKAFELQPGEEIIDTWPLIYSPPGGGVFDGRCTVTNRRIVYASELDITVKEILAEFIDPNKGNRGYLVIPKTRIMEIEAKRSYLEKRVILTLDNGQRHEFSYGALNIDRLVEAMEKNS